MIDDCFRRLSTARMPASATAAPTVAELAEIEREFNGGKTEKSDNSSSSASNGSKAYQGPRVATPPTLREWIQRLDRKVVARIHRDARHLGNDRWPTIERLLEVVSKVSDARVERFVARCEQG